ncbi:OLC1v1020399C1 [Oldenlandia corymbosa var. corymbosa]|uniref:OLC1v1020399C1 n=1 Tax=Oldenlandia corymbosa var. corymbosa TaxID=529605 RepID=A0AAV1EGI1_OLDCO|nr:OLC1v1020399C1 [Oldenlandia corymbosa var. corymbosa]
MYSSNSFSLPATSGRRHHLFVSISIAERPLHVTVTPGTWRSGKRLDHYQCRLKSSIVSRQLIPEELREELQNGIQEVLVEGRIKEAVEGIKRMLRTMEDGEISISPYDTAWVALVEDINGSGGGPQFPASVEWIADHQLPDGSWGDGKFFQAHDRIINTLACVIALEYWGVHSDISQKGLLFIKGNISKLEEDNAVYMPCGFEVTFPSLIDLARKLSIDIQDDAPIFQEIYDRRNVKLARIPMEVLHSVPTSLLYSLEGMPGIDWPRLLRFKSKDGSFYTSPASTAYAFMQTKDDDCLRYLTSLVKKFKGGVPNVYPVDLFERIWAVDRLQRLGISRYFQSEIEECVNYVYCHWTDTGICWARNSLVHDIDDTAMGFRVLRLEGYPVSADVFNKFKRGDEFFCIAGQSDQGLTGIYNLYRACGVMFPSENVLAGAKKFSSEFLNDKRAKNDLIDKWIISKDLAGEVGYALDFPWYASLPRVETRMFLEQYGGEDDVWIGKTLYRMYNVNNNIYLELGKLDYNNCQGLHQQEWTCIQKWFKESGLRNLGILSERDLLYSYYLATASIFEPERAKERIAWAKTNALINTTKSCLSIQQYDKRTFLQEMEFCGNSSNSINGVSYKPKQTLNQALLDKLNQLSMDIISSHTGDMYKYLRQAWENWWMGLQAGSLGKEAELIVWTLIPNQSTVRYEPLNSLISHPKYQQLMDVTNRICLQCSQFQFQIQHKKDQNMDSGGGRGDLAGISSIDSSMQELVESVLTNSPGDLDSDLKNTVLTVAKSFYYTVHCNPQTINSHIAKVLFEKVP